MKKHCNYRCENGCCCSVDRPIRCFNPARKRKATAAVPKAVTRAVKRAVGGDEPYIVLDDGTKLSATEICRIIAAAVQAQFGLGVVRSGLKDGLIAQLKEIVARGEERKGRKR